MSFKCLLFYEDFLIALSPNFRKNQFLPLYCSCTSVTESKGLLFYSQVVRSFHVYFCLLLLSIFHNLYQSTNPEKIPSWKEDVEGYFTSPILLSKHTHYLIIWINIFNMLKVCWKICFPSLRSQVLVIKMKVLDSEPWPQGYKWKGHEDFLLWFWMSVCFFQQAAQSFVIGTF